MKNNVDFSNEESVEKFINGVVYHMFDQGGVISYNVNLRKASYCAFHLISLHLKSLTYEYSSSVFYLFINPLLQSFKDTDPKIIIEAANALIKILKNLNKVVLKYFSDIFEGLLVLNVNPDQDVRNLSNSLDDLLKETINGSIQIIEFISKDDFKIEDLIAKLIEKIRANHPAIKILIVTWITFLDTIAEIKLLNYLHEFLPGLLNMLCDKTRDVHQSADKCLKHFLKDIESQFNLLDPDIINKLLENIIDYSRSNNEQAKITSFEWLYTFLHKYSLSFSAVSLKNSKIQQNYYMKLGNFPADKNQIKFSFTENPHHSKIEPEFSFKHSKSIEEKIPNISIMYGIPYGLFPKILDVILLNLNSTNENIVNFAHKCNSVLIKMLDYYNPEFNKLNVRNFEDVLKNYFSSKKENIIDMVLNWIVKLFRKFNDEMFNKIDNFIDNLSSIMTDCNEQTFNKILEILCEISKFREEYIDVIIQKLTDRFVYHKNLFNAKGLTILKTFSQVFPVSRVFLKFADALMKVKDLEFITITLNILDIFLLTYKETESLRAVLRNLRKNTKDTREIKEFFDKIFRAWCYNPVSVLILCMISEYFELSYNLILKL